MKFRGSVSRSPSSSPILSDPLRWQKDWTRRNGRRLFPARIGDAIYRYEGTIAQLLGDGVLAFFGAPLTHEDDPVRAIHAALAIQAAMREYERELKGLVETFQMRIGVNTGTVVLGDIGSDMHLEYLAFGDAVNLAARLQSAARPGRILLSETTARLAETEFELQDLGLIEVKGKSDPLPVFEVLRATPGRKARAFPRRLSAETMNCRYLKAP